MRASDLFILCLAVGATATTVYISMDRRADPVEGDEQRAGELGGACDLDLEDGPPISLRYTLCDRRCRELSIGDEASEVELRLALDRPLRRSKLFLSGEHHRFSSRSPAPRYGDRVDFGKGADGERFAARFSLGGASRSWMRVAGRTRNTRVDFEGIVYLCEETRERGAPVEVRCRYAIEYHLHLENGRSIAVDSELWLGELETTEELRGLRLPSVSRMGAR